MNEITMTDLDSNVIKLILTEEFHKFGQIQIQIKADNYRVVGIVWITRGELIGFCSELEKMYEQMKGKAILKDFEDALSVEFTLDNRGYVLINGRFKEKPSKNTELTFEMKTTQSQIDEIIKDIKKSTTETP